MKNKVALCHLKIKRRSPAPTERPNALTMKAICVTEGAKPACCRDAGAGHADNVHALAPYARQTAFTARIAGRVQIKMIAHDARHWLDPDCGAESDDFELSETDRCDHRDCDKLIQKPTSFFIYRRDFSNATCAALFGALRHRASPLFIHYSPSISASAPYIIYY